MIEKKRYDIVIKALQLACEELKNSNIEVNKNNTDMLAHIAYDTLIGYFLMKADEDIQFINNDNKKNKDVNNDTYFDIDYIKEMFCKYKCPAQCDNKSIEANITAELDIKCCKCDEIFNKVIYETVNIENPCDICLINDFIRELRDYKLIK